jgi:hypothetical protein
MSKSPLFGQSTKVMFSVDGGQSFIEICELESFTFSNEDEVKKNTVLGEAGIGSLDVIDMGGTASCETKKRDSKTLVYFVNQAKQMRAGTGGDTFGPDGPTKGQRGRVPYWTIVQQSRYTDNTVENLFLYDAVLHNYGQDNTGSASEVSEKFQITYTKMGVLIDNSGDSNGANMKSALGTGIGNIGRSTGPDESAAYNFATGTEVGT